MIPEVPYYVRVTSTKTNNLMKYLWPPRLPLKAEPQILPQISSNLDVCPDPEKGKKWEPWKQNGGFVEESLKSCQQGTKRLRLPSSVTSKFAVLDERPNTSYVRYGKEEKILEVPYYIWVSPTKTNKLMTYVWPPRDPIFSSKFKPAVLPKQFITTKKAASVPEQEVDRKGPEYETNDCAEYYKQDTILQPEPVTSLEDILYPAVYVTCLKNNNFLEGPVCTIKPHTNRLTEEMPVNHSHPQSTFSCSPDPTNLDSQNPVTGHCHLLQFMSLQPTEVVACLEDNNSQEFPDCTIKPHTSGLQRKCQ
ncbi:Hypothetical predicted protein [Pelobates cultripes]|uniref:Uncharacterized protein n=1 Tax=Pelobates cultripes TaxID=61616 RepID=A0AAD1TIM1_PELCU|nr:Hypothetical predicted protein [Pelobates cultripes]